MMTFHPSNKVAVERDWPHPPPSRVFLARGGASAAPPRLAGAPRERSRAAAAAPPSRVSEARLRAAAAAIDLPLLRRVSGSQATGPSVAAAASGRAVASGLPAALAAAAPRAALPRAGGGDVAAGDEAAASARGGTGGADAAARRISRTAGEIGLRELARRRARLADLIARHPDRPRGEPPAAVTPAACDGNAASPLLRGGVASGIPRDGFVREFLTTITSTVPEIAPFLLNLLPGGGVAALLRCDFPSVAAATLLGLKSIQAGVAAAADARSRDLQHRATGCIAVIEAHAHRAGAPRGKPLSPGVPTARQASEAPPPPSRPDFGPPPRRREAAPRLTASAKRERSAADDPAACAGATAPPPKKARAAAGAPRGTPARRSPGPAAEAPRHPRAEKARRRAGRDAGGHSAAGGRADGGSLRGAGLLLGLKEKT